MKTKSIEAISQEITRLSKRGSQHQFAVFFNDTHEADIADALSELSDTTQKAFFKRLNPELAAEVLEELNIELQIQLISEYKTEKAAKVIEEMDSDDAADLLEELSEEDGERAEEIIDALPDQDAEDIKELLSYNEDSAGAIMSKEFISIPENQSVSKAISLYRQQDPPESEAAFYVFIVDKKQAVLGVATLRTLLMADPKDKVSEIRTDYPVVAHVDMDQEEVAKLFQKYDLIVLPVVDTHDTLVGLITVDDVVDVVIEEATEDIYKLSGTTESADTDLIHGRIAKAIQARLPWLFLTIIGGGVASFIMTQYVQAFTPGMISLTLSLSFVPLLMGLGGNIGNQSATIIVRGLATGDLKEKKEFHYMLRETVVGACIGATIGAIVTALAILCFGDQTIAMILGVSVFLNSTVAAFIGASLPILLRRIHIDPAVASAPFISTALDIISQIIYFVLILFVLSKVLL